MNVARWLASVRYRQERRWLDRDPYGYVRAVLGVHDMTDAEMDAAAANLGAAIRAQGVSASEAAAALWSLSASPGAYTEPNEGANDAS